MPTAGNKSWPRDQLPADYVVRATQRRPRRRRWRDGSAALLLFYHCYLARRRLRPADPPLIREARRASPCSRAKIATCVRLEHGSWRRIAFMWTLTVASVISHARAI